MSHSYSLISTGGNGVIKENGTQVLTIPQHRYGLLVIEPNGTLSWRDQGYYTYNYVRFSIWNPNRYRFVIDWKNGNTRDTFDANYCNGPWLDIPWEGGDNYMNIGTFPSQGVQPIRNGTSYTEYTITWEGDLIYLRSSISTTKSVARGQIIIDVLEPNNVQLTLVSSGSEATVKDIYTHTSPYEIYSRISEGECFLASSLSPPKAAFAFSQLRLDVYTVPVIDPCQGRQCGELDIDGQNQCFGPCPQTGRVCELDPNSSTRNYICVESDPCRGQPCGGQCSNQTCGEGYTCELVDGEYTCVEIYVPPENPCEGKPCGGSCDGPCPKGECVLSNGVYKCVQPFYQQVWFIVLMVVIGLIILAVVIFGIVKLTRSKTKSIPEPEVSSEL
jgi:hypothetical protein